MPDEPEHGAEERAATEPLEAASREAEVFAPAGPELDEFEDSPDAVETPLAQPPKRPRRRFDREAPPVPWTQRVVPSVGLILCLGCLWTLVGVGILPGWTPWWLGTGIPTNAAVIIDPGHGGGDTGAVAQGVVEKDLNLDVGQRVARTLRARGVKVRLTRETDYFVPLEGRVRFANALPGAVFVSIHFNDASGNGQATARASGIETYYCEHKLTPAAGWQWASLLGRAKAGVPDARWAVREGQALADCIQGSLIAGTRAENRGIKERSLYVTHRVSGPAVLVEGGFVSHPGEARKLADTVYRQVLAECIAEGIVKYLRGGGQSAPGPVLAASTAGGGA